MFSTFSLEVVMDGYTEDSSRRNKPSTLIATANSVKISREQHTDPRSQQFIAVLIPHTMVEASLRRTVFDRKTTNSSSKGSTSNSGTGSSAASRVNSKCVWLEQADRFRLSRDLLPRIHSIFTPPSNITSTTSNTTSASMLSIFNYQPQLQQKQQHTSHSSIMIRAIFSTTGKTQHSPADVVLLDIPNSSRENDLNPSELLQATNGDGMTEEPNSILKLLLISQVHIASSPMNLLASVASLEIPLCPVCLHRIDPVRLGLPKPLNHHLCSKFCQSSVDAISAVASLSTAASETTIMTTGCPKQRFLRAWPEPSHCIACRVIHDYQTVGAATNFMSTVYCHQCALQKTLWVCLGCGFVGCGRYSNKHAEAHFLESGHNYSLELATLRIWEYANGEFAHRCDLLECPSGRQQRARALQLQQQMVASLSNNGAVMAAVAANSTIDDFPSPLAAALGGSASLNSSDTSDMWEQQQPYYWHDQGSDEKSPKKAIMIGEEYEALLQSALEDQAQHYQGEISRLRAALTAEQVDMDSLTPEEVEVIETLKSEISALRTEADMVGRKLLDAQAQEAGHRADSQRLLREQQVAQDLLKTIQEQTKHEHEQGRRQIEELEQQIEDLTANLRMRQQFSLDQELSNAQIFGTLSAPDNAKASAKKGKLRRLFRK